MFSNYNKDNPHTKTASWLKMLKMVPTAAVRSTLGHFPIYVVGLTAAVGTIFNIFSHDAVLLLRLD